MTGTPPPAPRSTRDHVEEQARRPRVDASMTLINEMMHRPLDPSYAAEAERRAAAGLPAARTPWWRAVLIAFLIGLLLVTAARALRQPKEAVASQRDALIAQIHTRQQAADALAAQRTTLQGQVAAVRGTALAGESREDLAARLDALESVAGAGTVEGPGLVITVDNSPQAAGEASEGDPRDRAPDDNGRVVSRDLLLVANGLWQAGAEAVSVNGQRLTSTSAIRFAGDAILVDYRPLARPYVITAIGDPDRLESDFTRTEGGAYIQGLSDSYGVVYRRERKDTVTCPAGSTPHLRHVRGAAPPTPATGQPTPGSRRATSPSPRATPSETSP